MNLHMTGHVLQRMTERQITRDEVKWVLANFEVASPTPQGSIKYEATIEGRKLKVWCVSPGVDAAVVVIKSAAWKD